MSVFASCNFARRLCFSSCRSALTLFTDSVFLVFLTARYDLSAVTSVEDLDADIRAKMAELEALEQATLEGRTEDSPEESANSLDYFDPVFEPDKDVVSVQG
eukprot:7272149-Pyramimonas_sp.AAC.3